MERVSFILVFLVTAIPVVLMKNPIIGDEYCILSNAATLAGKYDFSAAYNSSVNGYWGYGFSIFLTPLFLITDSMEVIYRAALIFNAVLLGLIAVVIYRLTIGFLGEAEKKFGLLVSVTLSLFPCYAFYSKYALNEIMLSFIAWLIIYLISYIQQHQVKRTKEILLYFAIGFLAVYAYAVHGRGIAITIATALTLFIFFILKKKVRFIPLALGLICSYLFDSAIKQVLYSHLILTNPENTNNTVSMILGSHSGFLKLDNLVGILKTFLSQAYYMVLVTLGIICVFAALYVCLSGSFWKKHFNKQEIAQEDQKLYLLGTFSFFSILITLFISTIYYCFVFINHETVRREYLIYGRYNDTLLVMGVFFVILFFRLKWQQKVSRSCWLTTGVLYGGIIVFGSIITTRWLTRFSNRALSYTMVEGLIPLTGQGFLEGTDNQATIRLFFIVTAVLIASGILLRRKKSLFVVGLLGFSLYSSTYSFVNFVLPSTEGSFESTEDAAAFFTDKVDMPCSTVYLAGYSGRPLNLQFKLQELSVESIKIATNGYEVLKDCKENSIILSDTDKGFDYFLENCYKVQYEAETAEIAEDTGESNRQLHIWVYGSELKEYLASQNIKFVERETKVMLDLEQFLSSSGDRAFQGNVYLVPDELMYGPYITAFAGEYLVTIEGTNLQYAEYEVTTGGGIGTYAVVPEGSSQCVQYKVNLPLNGVQTEFLVRNISVNKLVTVTNVIIERITEAYEGDLTYLYDSKQEYSWQTLAGVRLFALDGAYSGQSLGRANTGGAISLTRNNLIPGEYEIKITGECLAGAYLMVEGKDIAREATYISDEEAVFNLPVEEHMENVTLLFKNSGVFPEMTIQYVSIQYKGMD